VGPESSLAAFAGVVCVCEARLKQKQDERRRDEAVGDSARVT